MTSGVLATACSRCGSPATDAPPGVGTETATRDAGTPALADAGPPYRGPTGKVVLGGADGGADGGTDGGADGGLFEPFLEGSLKDGHREGRWTSWYAPEKKAAELSFQAGRRHGPFTLFWPDGSVAATGRYAKGRLESVKHDDSGSLGPVMRPSLALDEPLVALHPACGVLAAVTAKKLIVFGKDTEVLWRTDLESPLASDIVERTLSLERKGPECMLQVHQQDGVLRFLHAKTEEEWLRSGASVPGPFQLGKPDDGVLELVRVEGREVRAVALADGAPRWSWMAPEDLVTPLARLDKEYLVADRTGQLWRVGGGSAQPFGEAFTRPVTALWGTPFDAVTLVTRGEEGFHLERLGSDGKPRFSSPPLAAEPRPVRGSRYGRLFTVGDRLLRFGDAKLPAEAPLPGLESVTLLANADGTVVLLLSPEGSITVVLPSDSGVKSHGPWRWPAEPGCAKGMVAALSLLQFDTGLYLACAEADRVSVLPLGAVTGGRKYTAANTRWSCKDCFAGWASVLGADEGLAHVLSGSMCAFDVYSGARAFCVGKLVDAPRVHDGILYFMKMATDAGPWQLHAVNATTGEPLWQSEEEFGRNRPEGRFPGVAPTARRDTVVVAYNWTRVEVRLVAFDALTGRTRFARSFLTGGRQAVEAVVVAEDTVVTLEREHDVNQVRFINLLTGEVRASFPLKHTASLAMDGTTVFLREGDTVKAFSPATPEVRWTWRFKGKQEDVDWIGFMVRDGLVLLDGVRHDGTIGPPGESLALNARTGRQLAAREDPPSCETDRSWPDVRLDSLAGVHEWQGHLRGVDLRRAPCQPKPPEL